MSFTITQRQAGDVTILDIKGNLFVSEPEDNELKNSVSHAVTQCASGGKNNILLNLKGTTDIDADGLDDVTESIALSEQYGPKLKLLVGEGSQVQRFFKKNDMREIVEIFVDDEAAALASFVPAPTVPAGSAFSPTPPGG